MTYHALLDPSASADTTIPLEQALTHQRFSKLQERTIENFGDSATAGGKALTEAYLPRLATAFAEAFAEKADGRSATAEILGLLRDVRPEV